MCSILITYIKLTNNAKRQNLSEMVYPDDATIPIAVVGLSGRFPGQAKNAEKLWEMCAAGENAWSPFPSDRFSSEAFYHPDSGRNGSVSEQ